jgi:hypothetical protein
MALPAATILSTNSPEHNKRLVELGATACIDRNLKGDEIIAQVQAAAPGLNGEKHGVDAILDAVAGAQDDQTIFGALHPQGLKLYSYVATGRDGVKVPEGVKSVEVFAHMMFMPPSAVPAPSTLEGMAGTAAMSRLVELVDEGKFRLPLDVQVVGRGLEDIGAGLEKLKGGVSGKKLVVSL